MSRGLLALLMLLAAMPAAGAQAPDKAHEDERLNFEAQGKDLEDYLDAQLDGSAATRAAFWHRDYSSQKAYSAALQPFRDKLAEMIGAPVGALRQPPLTAKQLAARRELVTEDGGIRIERVWLKSRTGLTAYGILLTPPGAGRKPAVVAIHGMSSSPERVAGLLEPNDYVRRFGRRLAERGYVVFAPLDIKTQALRDRLDRKAMMLGTRLQWLEQAKIFADVDFLYTLAEVDPHRIGAYGISWGGRTVMYQGALDQRIAATVISGHFNDTVPKMVTSDPHYTAFINTREGYAFYDKLATRFSDADVVSMICPRAVMIEEGKRDPVVWYPMAEKAFAEAQAHYKKLNAGERAELKLFDGDHFVYAEDAFPFLDRWLKGGAR